MPQLRVEAPQNHQVCIRYGDGVHSFPLACGTTLGELALRVGGLDSLHDASPLMIEVVIDHPHGRIAPVSTENSISH